MTAQWKAPAGLDPEVLSLCQALNALPGITTAESCSGHGREPVRIWFLADSLADLPVLLYWLDACHTGLRGWSVVATTDCAASPVIFRVEGPCGGYAAADEIAAHLSEQARELTREDEIQ
jgi:hypothetical protein